MSDSIRIENISKLYRLGEVGTGTISHDLNRWWHRIRGKEDPYLQLGQANVRDAAGSEYVWALKDISFNVQQGEVLGIIGKNGAGKSTLLKLLSRVTAPTTGTIKVKGRIASLLEVGTGFHPELTGRENIYLNGAILGMTKKEIQRKFDEIVEFAGVERYIDTPVKRYSSGMYVRLAFGVAAHLESEILIVDEVLAVGDAEFQNKCLGKMSEVTTAGRTVLFVSHNMDSIRKLCAHTVILDKGAFKYMGRTNEIIPKYLSEQKISYDVSYEYKGLVPSITRIELDQESLSNGDLLMRIYYKGPQELKSVHPGFVLYNSLNQPIFGSNTRYHRPQNAQPGTDEGFVTARFSNLNLHSGLYKISFWLGDEYTNFDRKEFAIVFDYQASDSYSFKPDSTEIGNIDYRIVWAFNK